MRAARLNATAACLFIVGSSGFVLGSVPAYADAVGGVTGAGTYVVGSLFFTAASFVQLLQVQTVSLTGAGPGRPGTPPSLVIWRRRPHDRVTIMRALVKETMSREHVDTLARDIEEACATLVKKGGAHESERNRMVVGPGH
jgi:hypothetical protein